MSNLMECVTKFCIKHYLKLALLFVVAMVIIMATSFYYGFRDPEAHAIGGSYTVCASGCDFTTLTGAFASTTLPLGSTLLVSATYDYTAETFPLSVPTSSLTIDCQSSGATIGSSSNSQVVINVVSSTLIQNCNLSSVKITGTYQTGVAVKNNTFDTTTTSTIELSSNTDFVIMNNTNIDRVVISGGNSASGTIHNNTFYYNASPNSSSVATLLVNGNNITISNNTISNYASTGFLSGSFLIYFQTGGTINFVTNTISYPVAPNTSFYNFIVNTTNTLVSGNYITLPTGSTNIRGVQISPTESNSRADVSHNTVLIPTGCSGCTGVTALDTWLIGGPYYSNYITSTYNLVFSPSHHGSANGIVYEKQGPASSMYGFQDYNGFWNLNYNFNATSLTASGGTNNKTNNPAARIRDNDTTNDLQLATFSDYLDVSGTTDIGAYEAARDSTINIDDNGVVDYSSVDATSTIDVESNLRNSDTVVFAAGSYGSFVVSSTASFTGGISIQGVGDSTILSPTSTTDRAGLLLKGISNSSVQNIVFKNASSSPTEYKTTAMIFTYNGNSYNDGPNIGGESNSAFVILDNSCNSSRFNADNTIVSAFNGSSDINLAVASVGADRITVLTPNSANSTEAALNASCSGVGLVVDKWVTSTFAFSNGTYTYNSAAVAAAGITLTVGFTNPPAITKSYNAGIKLVNSSSNTFTSVTSTINGLGVWFNGTSGSNTFTGGALSSSVGYDVYSDSTGNNTFQNVSFTRASSTITGTGVVNVYFKARAYVVNSNATAVADSVYVASADGSNTATLTADSTGYSGFSSYLFAFILSSSSISATNGGYNPYAFGGFSTSNYTAATSSANLVTPFQTVTVTLSGGSTPASTAASTPSASGGWFHSAVQTVTESVSNVVNNVIKTENSNSDKPTDKTSSSVNEFNSTIGGDTAINNAATNNQPYGSTDTSSKNGTEISVPKFCSPLITKDIIFGGKNDVNEVKNLQTFLNEHEGEKLKIDGVYSVDDVEAVKRFQVKYESSVLAMWGLKKPTGYVHKTTAAKINSLECKVVTTCPVFTEFNNYAKKLNIDSPEILQTKSLLANLGFYTGTLDTKFTLELFNSIIKFQEEFRAVMLTPWGLTKGTGFKYKTTNKYLNTLSGCDTGPVELEGRGVFDY